MADDQLTVVRADTTVETLRSLDVGGGVQMQVVGAADATKVVPTLTGATIGLISVGSSSAVALDPPDAGAQMCFVRVWEDTAQTDVRIFYRRDGTAPTNAGANCEGFLMHTEGVMVRIPTLTNFKLIGESGSAWHITCEFSDI